MPLGKLRKASRKQPAAKSSGTQGGSEAELMASRSTALRLTTSAASIDSSEDLSSTGSPTVDQPARHRVASGSFSSLNGEDSASNGGSQGRRHSMPSSSGSGGGSARSRGGVDGVGSHSSGGSGGLNNSGGSDSKLRRRTSLFISGANGGEARVVRVFFKDETYRSVRFMEEESCAEVLDRLWPRLDLEGNREDYRFYIVYKKQGNRFVNDDEYADVLLGSDWLEVEKIYIRHKDDKEVTRRVIRSTGNSEVLLKAGKAGKASKMARRDSMRVSSAPNPFSNVTGDSHTVHVDAERPISKFAQAFSQAWENAEILEVDEERSSSRTESPPSSPVKFDSISDSGISTTNVAAYLRSLRYESGTDSGRGSLERKAEAPGDDMDSTTTPQRHRRSISSITSDSGVSLHQADLDSPMLRKAMSRTSFGSSGGSGSPRNSTKVSRYSHSYMSKMSFVPVDVNIGDAPPAPVAPYKSAVTSPGSHYSIPSARSSSFSSDGLLPSSLPPPPPEILRAGMYGSITSEDSLPPPAPEILRAGMYGSVTSEDSLPPPAPPSPTPSLPPPPSAEELMRMNKLQFSFQLTIDLQRGGLHC